MLKHFKYIFEFYIGFENLHFGLRLPPTSLNSAFDNKVHSIWHLN